MMKLLTTLCLTVVFTVSLAQNKREVLLTDLLLSAIKNKQDTAFEDLTVSMSNISTGVWPNTSDSVRVNGKPVYAPNEFLETDVYLKLVLPKTNMVNGKVSIPTIEFIDCEFPDGLYLSGLHMEGDLGIVRAKTNNQFRVTNVDFGGVYGHYNEYQSFLVKHSTFTNGFHAHWDSFTELYIDDNTIYGKIELLETKLSGVTSIQGNVLNSKDKANLQKISNDSLLYGREWLVYDKIRIEPAESSGNFSFNDNKSSGSLTNIYRFEGNFEGVYARKNQLNGIVQMATNSNELVILDNDFELVSIHQLQFSETLNDIKWKDFAGNKLCVLNTLDNVSPSADGLNIYDFKVFGLKDSTAFFDYFENQSENIPQVFLGTFRSELADEDNFRKLFRSYYKLYNALRDNGDVESANAAYIELKDLETNRLSYLYSVTRDYDYLYRYGLNQLLKVYTDHGTNPAKAVRVSGYFIFLFAIFYFFFPSEWDKESKSELMERYRKFVRKNKHGYFKPFLHLMKGFSISLLNALVLSMNAFVTLGFGKIPTTGLARYVCIVQGTIGWFLLSIFTVALINQLLI